MIREEAIICSPRNLDGGGRKLVAFPALVPSSMGVTVFGGLVCGLYVENLEAGHYLGGSLYAQVSATLSSFAVQVPVFIWWVMVFGFASGRSLYLVVEGVSVLPCAGGRRNFLLCWWCLFSIVGSLVSRLCTQWGSLTLANYEAPGVVWVFSLPCNPWPCGGGTLGNNHYGCTLGWKD